MMPVPHLAGKWDLTACRLPFYWFWGETIHMTTLSARVLPKRLANYFADYASYHRTPGNKICHYLGIPMITVTLLGLLSAIVIGGNGLTGSEILRLDGGTLLLLLSTLWYLTLDWKIALPFGLFAIGMYFLGRAMPTPVLWTFFVLGWIIQFVGHYKYEKKSPAFFTNLTHVLVGPLWIFAKLIRYTH